MSRDTLICLALGCFTVLVFAPARHNGFINYDDPAYVRAPHVQRGLTLDGTRWAFTTMHFANYHPLTWLSHMADVSAFGGDNPGGHHLTSVAIHAINAVLLYLVLLALSGQRGASVAVATVWAVHPLRVESVAWVAERKDLLCGMFFLLAIGAYAYYVKRKSRSAYVASILCFVLALMSKSMAVTLPFVLLLLDCWPLKRPARLGWLVIEKLPFLVLTVVFCIVTVVAQRRAGAMTAGEVYPLTLRFTNALWAYGRYVELTLWPSGLAIIYPYHGALPGTRVPPIAIALGVALLIGVSALGTWMWRKREERALLVGWLWFIGTLVPVIGIVQVGWQSMADRYTYLPQIGLLIAIIWPINNMLRRANGGRAVATGVAGVIAITLAWRTQVEIDYWRNNITLFSRAVSVTDKNHVALSALALGYDEAGDIPAAIDRYKQALAITPREPQLFYNIGRLYLLQQDWPLAEQWLRAALAIDPKHADAIINLGKVYSGSGRRDDAIATLRRAVEIAPRNAVAHYDLAVELAEKGHIDEALPHFADAIRLQPDVPELHYSYSVALRQAGHTAEADVAYRFYVELARRRGITPLPNRANGPATTTTTTRSSHL